MTCTSLLTTLTLSSLAFESVVPLTSAFVPPSPAASVIQLVRFPSQSLCELKLRRTSDRAAVDAAVDAATTFHHFRGAPRLQHQNIRNQALNTLHCSPSSAAASSDSPIDDDPWLSDLVSSAESINLGAAKSTRYLDDKKRVPNENVPAQQVEVDQNSQTSASILAAKPLGEGRTLRRMQECDIDGVVGLACEEFYEGPIDVTGQMLGTMDLWSTCGRMWRELSSSDEVDQTKVEELSEWLEMIWLRVVIRLGFKIRLLVGKGDRDHRVFCVTDEEGADGSGAKEDVLALAEISLQVPNGRTAPSFPVPVWVKKLKAWPGPVSPYISNVLVTPKSRRQGLAKSLVQRCEQQARDWGYTQVYLHVDITYWPAVHLYESLGYELVSMLEVHYMIPRLRYMKKIL